MHLQRPIFFILVLPSIFLVVSPLYANNATVSNAALVEQDHDAGTIKVEFDLSWENAWSNSINHDAAWVFMKFNTNPGSSTWKHVTLAASGKNPPGFSRGTRKVGSAFNLLDIVIPSDKKGAIIKPAHQISGAGKIDFENIRLVWDYAADGVSDAEASNSTMSVKVFAIEMAYIPEGGFFAGDGNPNEDEAVFEMGTGEENWPGVVNSEGGISFRNNTQGAWYYNSDSTENDELSGADFDVSASFPKGYAAFYLMKYEITQGQYTDFLNTLTSTQDSNRFPNQAGNNRHTIGGTAGSRTVTFPNRVVNYLSWMDLAAYLHWAALRPMTELEFEKAARGPLDPVLGEYAWGTTSKQSCTQLGGGSDPEDGTEVCGQASRNIIFGDNAIVSGAHSPNQRGPVRAGVFATSTSDTREKAGAGYYGTLDLSGNVAEMTVTLGNSAGRKFAGTHGDGDLNANGHATNSDWPGFVAGNGVTTAAGSGVRGGSWQDTTDARASISSRYLAAAHPSSRHEAYGGRGARTAP